MKKFRKLIPALALLLVSAVLMSTASYAWFSMNNKVTVTGMEVKTKVSNNLLIAPTTTEATSALTDSAFKTSVVADISAVLEPVSTINGSSYYYAKNNNVQGTGAVLASSYIAYDRTNNAGKNAFDGNYGFPSDDNDEDCVGYVDYAFQLKATNTSESADAYINVTAANLVYGTTQTVSENAFRIAIFVEDVGASLAATSGSVGTLKTILKPTSAAYFGAGGVTSTTAVAAIPTLGTAANIATVAHGTTHYYKVVVRLWIEGEDTTCNNSTFATLTDDWALDLKLELQDATGGVTVLATSVTSTKINLASDTASATTVVVDGVTYYQLTTNNTYYTLSSTLSSTSRIFSMVDGHPIEVTNQCTLPSGS